jgi:hypothetical protein
MGRTQLSGKQILDRSIQKDDLDTITSGQAVITKLIAGTGVTLASNGVDDGTGEVVISLKGVTDNTTKNIDGGCPDSIYLETQRIDGGGP